MELLLTKHGKSHEHVDELESKLIKLIDNNAHLEKKISDQQIEITQLVAKNKVLKLARSLSGDQASDAGTDVKLKINELVREVDKCIGMLNK